MNRSDALALVLAEREKQPTAIEDTNTKNDFVAFITAYAGRAADKCYRNEREGQTFRDNMVKVAALALAALERHE